MPVGSQEIVAVFSGGGTNDNPNRSLGGEPSSRPITTTLFDSITEKEAGDGRTDYRCFYFFNDNDNNTFYDTELFMSSKVDTDTIIELGVQFENDVQRITVTGNVASGSFSLNVYPSTVGAEVSTITVNHNSNPTTFASNLQTAINTVVTSVVVTVSSVIQASPGGPYTSIIFNIAWQDDEEFRYQELLTVDDNNLTTGTITIAKLANGKPINGIASSIDVETTVPANVTFEEITDDNRIDVGNLRPLDGFPVWIKRVISPSTEPFDGDGFTLRIEGRTYAGDIA